jgi:co-chaperonin GroES (HSP10)|tara:strand:+ start:1258 stop:1698 length:441 start_codon:yes stop_codon:yes gene_type:complete
MTKEVVPDVVMNFDKAPARVPEEVVPEEKSVEEITSQTEKLPQPTGYRVLILPRGRSAVTDGGIQLVSETIERDTVSSVVGYVISLGPDAYKDPVKFPEGAWCEEGEWVLFGRYAGARFKIDGGELRILNDDEILARIPDPEAVDY